MERKDSAGRIIVICLSCYTLLVHVLDRHKWWISCPVDLCCADVSAPIVLLEVLNQVNIGDEVICIDGGLHGVLLYFHQGNDSLATDQ